MPHPVGRQRDKPPQRTKDGSDGSGRVAAPEEEDAPRREMARELESEHAAEGSSAEIKRLRDPNVARDPSGVSGKRLAWAGRHDPAERPDVANFALRIEEAFVSADSRKDEKRSRHAAIVPAPG